MESIKIAIYGAYGHTGRFLVARLYERGWRPVLCGRDADKLRELNRVYPDLECRTAEIDRPTSLDAAFRDAGVVVNCAGPFLDTAPLIIESALRLSIHYIDVNAEQQSVLDIFEQFSEKAATGKSIILPAMAFFGGLPDLLATAAVQDWEHVDEITTGIALSYWNPTTGTRLTGQRNHYPRLIFSGGELVTKPENLPALNWTFPQPFGTTTMVAMPFSEIISITRHLNVNNVSTYLSLNSLEDIRSKETPPPIPSDDRGRSSQEFCVEVKAKKGQAERIARATGKDIYAVTAPLVAEAIERIASGDYKQPGVTTPGQIFDAGAFLNSLASDDILVSLRA